MIRNRLQYDMDFVFARLVTGHKCERKRKTCHFGRNPHSENQNPMRRVVRAIRSKLIISIESETHRARRAAGRVRASRNLLHHRLRGNRHFSTKKMNHFAEVCDV